MLVEGLEGPLAIATASIGAFALVTALVGLWQWYATRRDVRALSAVSAVHPNDRLFTAVLTARSRFTEAVRTYERALAEPATVSVREHAGGIFSQPASGLAESSGTPIDVLSRQKDEARDRLIVAQREWEEAKPPLAPSSQLALWSGAGLLRGWNIGPVGFEQIVVRVDHAVDYSCWSAWRLARFRFGFALGAERQQLAMFIFGAECGSMGELLSRGFGGGEAAFRPGFVPTRTWRRGRRDDISRRSIDAVLSGASSSELLRVPADATRQAVASGYSYELGLPLSDVERLPTDDSMLAIHTKGPSVLFGVWGGRDPQAKLVASSTHQAWQLRH